MLNKKYQTILVEHTVKSITLTINRPEKRNALNHKVICELTEILTNLRDDKAIRCIFLQGRGSTFSSGADIEELIRMKDYDIESTFQESMQLAELYLLIYSFPVPVIALVTGPALGGGCGLATVCDFIIATPDALFGYPEVKIGFIAAIVSVFLIRQVGERRARYMLLSGKKLSADQALAYGLISDIVEESNLKTHINELILKISENSPMALAKTKSMLADFSFSDLKNEITKMARLNAEYRKNPDFIEGVMSFVEKRKPYWTL
jgi:methylglutaconyl-CoA hydratase